LIAISPLPASTCPTEVGPSIPHLDATLDASLRHDGAPGAREEFCVQHARNPGDPADNIFSILKLFLKGRVQFLEVLEGFRISRLGPDLLFR
jgi:hypothetical protein